MGGGGSSAAAAAPQPAPSAPQPAAAAGLGQLGALSDLLGGSAPAPAAPPSSSIGLSPQPQITPQVGLACLLACLPTGLPACLPACLLACLLACLPAELLPGIARFSLRCCLHCGGGWVRAKRHAVLHPRMLLGCLLAGSGRCSPQLLPWPRASHSHALPAQRAPFQLCYKLPVGPAMPSLPLLRLLVEAACRSSSSAGWPGTRWPGVSSRG
jgi:hypothetical protein